MRSFIIIISSFLLPWAVGIIFFLKDKRIFAIIAPFSVMLAYTFNTIGIDLGFFYPLPVEYFKTHTLSIFPNLGLLPVISCIFIYLTAYTKFKPIILNIIISGIFTLIDMIFIWTKFLEYAKGWNYIYTILMYFITFNFVSLYYSWLKKLQIIPGR